MKAVVDISLKPGVLDTQGETICKALNNLGFTDVKSVRVSKRIHLDVADSNLAHESITKMSKQLLANEVMEDFDIELEE